MTTILTRSPACVVTNRLHGRAKIGDVQTAPQALWQSGLKEFDDKIFALLTDINTDLIVGQIDNNATCIFIATAKINVFERRRA